jgi:hypothetical protein
MIPFNDPRGADYDLTADDYKPTAFDFYGTFVW